ncbi:putative uncharacterized protein DDB_G0288537 [Cyclospora cayetanensis]|uniref:Uncharacterized protein n=1 Tax=Cyclospora cayetanensis TaxID=88456 RepID=A0A6P6RZK0_9EIME|nr:putative uncharacterized protein DDB_G0288537 [Cyclospora cayetanensis]
MESVDSPATHASGAGKATLAEPGRTRDSTSPTSSRQSSAESGLPKKGRDAPSARATPWVSPAVSVAAEAEAEAAAVAAAGAKEGLLGVSLALPPSRSHNPQEAGRFISEQQQEQQQRLQQQQQQQQRLQQQQQEEEERRQQQQQQQTRLLQQQLQQQRQQQLQQQRQQQQRQQKAFESISQQQLQQQQLQQLQQQQLQQQQLQQLQQQQLRLRDRRTPASAGADSRMLPVAAAAAAADEAADKPQQTTCSTREARVASPLARCQTIPSRNRRKSSKKRGVTFWDLVAFVKDEISSRRLHPAEAAAAAVAAAHANAVSTGALERSAAALAAADRAAVVKHFSCLTDHPAATTAQGGPLKAPLEGPCLDGDSRHLPDFGTRSFCCCQAFPWLDATRAPYSFSGPVQGTKKAKAGKWGNGDPRDSAEQSSARALQTGVCCILWHVSLPRRSPLRSHDDAAAGG